MKCVSHYVSCYCNQYYYSSTCGRYMCFRLSLITVTVMIAPTSVDLTVLLPQLILMDLIRGTLSLTTMLQHQQPQPKMSFQAYTSYAMGPSQVSFVFRGEFPTDSYVIFWHLFSAFRFPYGRHAHHWGLNHCGLQQKTLWNIPLADT